MFVKVVCVSNSRDWIKERVNINCVRNISHNVEILDNSWLGLELLFVPVIEVINTEEVYWFCQNCNRSQELNVIFDRCFNGIVRNRPRTDICIKRHIDTRWLSVKFFWRAHVCTIIDRVFASKIRFRCIRDMHSVINNPPVILDCNVSIECVCKCINNLWCCHITHDAVICLKQCSGCVETGLHTDIGCWCLVTMWRNVLFTEFHHWLQ